MAYVIGIDIGGTFTDAVVLDAEAGEQTLSKAPTTPRDLKQGVLEAVRVAARHLNRPPREILGRTVKFAHGTTATTNALVQGRLVKVGLIATAGFEDQLIIMRAIGRVAGLTLTERLHFSQTDKPEPYQGRVLTPLNLGEAREAVQRLLNRGVQAIAIALLWSFKNPEHEQAIKRLIQEMVPELFVTASSEHFPVMGEYERTSTTAINCAIGPIMASYIQELELALQAEGLKVPLSIMTSAGGITTTEQAVRVAVTTIGSGPAAGVIASQYLAEAMGHRNVIVTDVGGTTFDVGLIVDGMPRIAPTATIRQYALLTPLIEVTSIGSGGGSVAWLDGTRLRVGPVSAGAEPGPACYGRGGEEPTVTDADLILGYINPEYFCGGEIRLQRELAEQAIRRRVAEPLFGGDLLKAAIGIREIIDSQMADLIRKVTVERGYDPKEFTMMAYGGAGPTHCVAYGKESGVQAIVVPIAAPAHSALGAAVSDMKHSFKVSRPHGFPVPPEVPSEVFGGLEREASLLLEREGIGPEATAFYRWVDMRYRRQVHELTVPVPGGRLGEAEIQQLAATFEELYQRLYGKGSAYSEAGIEVISYRVDAVGRVVKPDLRFAEEGPADPAAARKGSRAVYWGELGGFAETPIYDGDRLRPGHLVRGPAILEYYGTTVVVNPECRARIDGLRNAIIRW
ncbi:MAG: hydantoinase/oxoprolinase family protein [Deltaproteobacteria bacterium]|nr:hydantoinase/oxoprolinase family protein [Deltaproteobacteria bacterium]